MLRLILANQHFTGFNLNNRLCTSQFTVFFKTCVDSECGIKTANSSPITGSYFFIDDTDNKT
jgi:hypothetical protein